MSTDHFPRRPTASPPAPTGPGWMWFAVWLIIGACYALSLLAAASIGLFLLPLPVLATILLARRRPAQRGLPGLVSGFGVPLLYLAYLNRAGPGTICTTITGGQDCTSQWSPWPWLTAGVTLLALGVAAFIAWQRRLPQVSEG